MALTFSYGDYTLEPKPLFNLSKEYMIQFFIGIVGVSFHWWWGD